MHMANELLSVPVAGATLGIAAAGLGFVCRKAQRIITSDKLALMGILGAFIFAAQMVNFQLPGMPGTSGHLVGAVLLAVILGPHLAAIVMSSVVIIQCLIFQDGGLLALGCNIINMALVPSYLGYFLYRAVTAPHQLNVRERLVSESQNPGASAAQLVRGSLRIYIGTMLACMIAVEAGAILVPLQTTLSGVLRIPFSTFLITMIGVHFLVGLLEGLVTVAVLGYLQQVRPDIVADSLPGKVRLSRKAVLATLVVFTVAIGAGLSLVASGLPDGLEWSYAERPDQPDFETVVSNEDSRVTAVDNFQKKYAPLPDYSRRVSPLGQTEKVDVNVSSGWTSFAGVLGSAITMFFIWLAARLLIRNPR